MKNASRSCLTLAFSLLACSSRTPTMSLPTHEPALDAASANASLDAGATASSDPDIVEAGRAPHEHDSAGDANTVADAGTARLVSATPEPNAVDVYPSPFGDGSNYHFEIVLEFSDAVNPARTRVRFGPLGESLTPYDVTWMDSTFARLAIQPPPLAPQILRENTTYVVDYSPLFTNANDTAEQRFEFTTGAYDALLNHSCGHTLFGPFGAGVASAPDATASFTLTTTHTQYAVKLAALGETFGGAVSLALPIAGPYRLYFDRPLTANLVRRKVLGQIPVGQAPKSCPGITHFADVNLDSTPATLVMDAVETDTIHVIVESLIE